MQDHFTIDMYEIGIYLIVTLATSVTIVILMDKSRSIITFSGGSLDRLGK